MIIGIAGKAGSGKDEVGKIIQYLTSPNIGSKGTYSECKQWGYVYDVTWTIQKFAQKLKDTIQYKFPNHFSSIRWEHSSQEYRDERIESLGMSRRTLLINEAMALRGVCRDYWVVALMSEYRSTGFSDEKVAVLEFPKWIITDLRFENEYSYIRMLEGSMVVVKRPGIQTIDSISETSLDHIIGAGKGLDDVIINDGTIEDLVQSTRHWMETRHLL